MDMKTNPYAGHRYPTEIISHAVWLYFRFTLSFRDIEELMPIRLAQVKRCGWAQVKENIRNFRSVFAKSNMRQSTTCANRIGKEELLASRGVIVSHGRQTMPVGISPTCLV